MKDDPNRKFELARGVRISGDPEKMTHDALVDAIYDVANYASNKLFETKMLQNIIRNAINK